MSQSKSKHYVTLKSYLIFGKMNPVNISLIEVVFYNCPSRNAGAAGFIIRNERKQIAAVGNTNGVSSCDHLIKFAFLQLLNF